MGECFVEAMEIVVGLGQREMQFDALFSVECCRSCEGLKRRKPRIVGGERGGFRESTMKLGALGLRVQCHLEVMPCALQVAELRGDVAQTEMGAGMGSVMEQQGLE